ncbi:unnamed protein product [Owenia fusiformis]|uniref:Uncharacterized protein n=1 Tax=Owenia fusiformis TaxID=6347 RepID=A0A8J1Y3A0_OWEFU|nr:unnamed protein product [Owenia fusiformis]
MSGLSKLEIARYRKVFDRLDRDGSGSISSGELKVALEEVGHRPSDEEVQELVKQIDTDGNGEVEWEEFLAIFQTKPKKKHTEASLRKAFDKIDKDKSGDLSSNEIRQFFRESGIGKDTLPDSRIDAMVAAVDINGDGQISFEEFFKMMNS